jgi:hypothetical protein
VPTAAVTRAVVDVGVVDLQAGRAVNAEDLDGCVLDVDVVDGRSAEQVVGVEEFWLGLSSTESMSEMVKCVSRHTLTHWSLLRPTSEPLRHQGGSLKHRSP